MAKRLTDRHNLDAIRFTREEPRDISNRGLLKVVDGILQRGSVYHILSDIPDDSGDAITILIDGETVINFELSRIHFEDPRLVGGPPRDVQIEALAYYRQRIGQGKHRIFLDKAVADARRLIAENRS